MLSAGPASSCDVCYERFVKDRKIPTSIACGHVFCNTCVGQITRISGDGDGLCPLCRKSFNYATCVKLHVDLESDTPKEDCPDEDLRQARKLQEAIAKIADEGISETKLRQLIQEAKAFLNTQPRNLHRELRVAHRMVSYLCEVKSSLRAQRLSTAKLNDEIAQLTKEKAGLLKQIEEAEEAHRAERESAMAVENSLRSSYNDAIEVYHATIDLYNKVAQQNSELMAKLSAHLTTKRPNHQEASIAPTPATTQSLLTPAVTAGHLQEVGVRDPNSSFLISPLPQFTSNLPTVSSRFAPLPDLTEEEEETYGERNGHSDDDEDDEGLFTEDEQPLPPLQRRGSENNLSLVSSGLSRTAPNSYVHNDYRRTRSHSYSNQPTSRSHSPSSSTIASSPSASPPSKNGQSIPPSQPRKIQDGRLKEILSYSPPTSSSFSSQSSGSFPSSYSSRDSSHSYDTQVSSGSYTNSISSKTPTPSHQQQSVTTSYSKQQPQQMSTSDNYAHLLASHPQSHLTKTAPSPSPNFQNKVSTASAQAQKLEEERLRKRREMEQEKLLQEYNEQHRAHDTETRMKGLSSGISTASAATVTSAGAQAQLLPRRDHYSSSTYVTPVITSNTTTAGTWRPTMNGSHAGSYGRPLPGAQPVTVYDQHHQTKYMASGNNSYPTKTSALPVNSTGVVSS